ncbi:MAG: DUF1800 domain-containing protein [Acetobacteraceae bacterium]|nr:DUF1800 domain-containing protein [Acetobacteraceae bacterium]MDW8398143.1 DUF1800 domain-containing protein [Acetobacteraceae bacterium]
MTAAHIALIRFGYGPRLGEPLPDDPAGWLAAQISRHRPAPAPSPLPDLGEGFRLTAERARMPTAETQRALNRLVADELAAWCAGCLAAEAPFIERLVAFWANHLCISRRAGQVAAFGAGHYVRQAIRPHVLGRFEDMLLAAVRHPAMLRFLDNAGSIGPNSEVGRRRNRGLNENLAREILELHSVTPAAGYTQEDVTEFAKVLTGWSFDAETGAFAFRPAAHEPGAKTVMGRRVEEGEEGGIALLRWLARHPATHRALARKLAAHFFADDPDPAIVRAVEGALRDGGGDLGAAARTLISRPEALSAPLAKLRPPHDLVLAALRAVGAPPDRALLAVAGMNQLAQPLWSPPSPKGWPDRIEDWAGPEALLARADWAFATAGRFARVDAQAAAEAALGRLARDSLRREIGRAGSAQDAMTLLLASPEFQRR